VPTIVTQTLKSSSAPPLFRRLAPGPVEADVAYEWIIDALDTTWGSIDRLVRPQPPRAMTRSRRVPAGA